MKFGLMGRDSWKTSILLMVLALIVSVLISYFQPFPGYMDADYYFAGGVQLAEGKGFTEPYMWNYFDPSNNLPHPSHGYWMPLASILTAGGMFITGSQTWLAGRIGFILIAMIIPVLTAELAYSFTKRKDLSLISGLLAIFSGYYAAYMQVTDTFGLYILLGGIFFLIAHRDNQKGYFLMGILAGFLHLARADGIFWLIISSVITFTVLKNIDYQEQLEIEAGNFTVFFVIVILLSMFFIEMIAPFVIIFILSMKKNKKYFETSQKS